MNTKRALHFAGGVLLGLLAITSPSYAKTVTYYYTDVQGTPLSTADASGVVTGITDRKPFGQVALGAESGSVGLTGHVGDDDTGFVYMQARFYDPQSARFLSVDPVTPFSNPQLNFQRYAYVANNPFTFSDPTGRQLHSDQQVEGGQFCGNTVDCSTRDRATRDFQLGSLDAYVAEKALYGVRRMWRGQAAHKVIEGHVQSRNVKSGVQVRAEWTFVTADAGRRRIDLMMRRGEHDAWSVFEIKPATPASAAAGGKEVQAYVSELSAIGIDAKVGTWSDFFPAGGYQQASMHSIVIGNIDFGGTYVYGPDEDHRGVITYESADLPSK